MVVVDKCCCCFGLRTGGIIVGWLGLVSAIGSLVKTIDLLDNFKWFQFDGIDHDTSEMFIKSYLHSQIVASVIQILMTVALLWGTHKGISLMILPWLIMNLIQIILVTLIILILAIVMFVAKLPIGGVLFLVIGLPTMALYTYIWISIFSLYHKVKAEERVNLNHRNEEIGFIPATAPNVIVKEESNPPPYNTLKNY